jgi:Ca2+-transporting ATPase
MKERQLNIPEHIKGLNAEDVLAARQQYGLNEQTFIRKNLWWPILKEMLKEPMLLLLIAVTILYFFIGEYNEAYFMLVAIVIVSGISFYQDNQSRKALQALEKMNEPLSKVIRESQLQTVMTSEIVKGDMVLVEEGNTINADGKLVYSNDFSVNESMLTGEAFSIFKSLNDDSQVYSGTIVASGMAIFSVEEIGAMTKLGKLGKSLADISQERTLLQVQINRFVKGMAIVGILFFFLIWVVNYIDSRDFVDSLLKGLTLAMSILPEEIPVAFTTFMALGSRRLMQHGVIVKKIRTVEALGSATVICSDKTGTITENKMVLEAVYTAEDNAVFRNEDWGKHDSVKNLIHYAMWSSEPVPFDPMEIEIHQVYERLMDKDLRRDYTMFHEYPLEGQPPMMTHVFQSKEEERIIATKGAPEAIIQVSDLRNDEKRIIQEQIQKLAAKGYRILGVAYSEFKGSDFPVRQQDLPFHFVGLVAFYDPPKENISEVFRQFYKAGIDVKIVTGDNLITTKAIAEQAKLRNADKAIDGDDLMKLDERSFHEKVKELAVFTRMFPEAKLSLINVLKDNQEVVAMVGDGVNDGPALKSAHIGIAMGKKGTEIAKQAAELILVEDDLSKMIDAVAMGRRIYTNLKKAVQYIVSIHIPIIFTVSLPLFLGWVYPNIFSPVHVIFLELIMGPTCSIVFENEPMEENAMSVPPRPASETFLSLREMSLSIIQGIVITVGVLFIYQYCVHLGNDENTTRAMVFSTLVFANIFLTLVNRSFYYSFIYSLKHRNDLLVLVLSLTVLLLGLILYVPAFGRFFYISPITISQIALCAFVGAISVFWFEIWKAIKRGKNPVNSGVEL